MGHRIKVERYGVDHRLESSEEFNAPSWEGIWQAVEGEMDRTGKEPSGMEGWEEGGCVLDPDHDCEADPAKCQENLKEAIRDWIKSAWEHDELKTGSFHFGGVDWSSITFGWDGE
ncbi:hypothetical protein SEA_FRANKENWEENIE_317 [Streptomyces phage Frankenweenie]|nr:hypothetical protein SEA_FRANKENWEENIE_317 [Streptomyces phage Frankenweenie]